MRVIRTRLFDVSVRKLRAADPELFEVVALVGPARTYRVVIAK